MRWRGFVHVGPANRRRWILATNRHRRRGSHAAARANEQSLNGLLVLAAHPRITNAHGEAVALLDRLRDDSAAQRNLDLVLNVVHGDAIAGGLLALDFDLQITLA